MRQANTVFSNLARLEAAAVRRSLTMGDQRAV